MRLRFFRPLALLFGFVCLCLAAGLFSLAQAAPGSPAATALSVTPDVTIERDGKRLPLAVKDGLMEKDVLISSASGKAQIIFTDDTTVSVAPNTTISLADFTYTETEQSFTMNVVGGILRVATGEVVRRNPKKFHVETPQASIGIRGTLLGVNAGAETTTLVLFETSGAGFEVTNKATGQVSTLGTVGYAMDVSDAGNTERPATPAEMQAMGQGTRATTLTAAAGPSTLTPVSDLAAQTKPQGGQGPEGTVESSATAPVIVFEDPKVGFTPPAAGGGLDLALIRGTFGGNYVVNHALASTTFTKLNVTFVVDGSANISNGSMTISDSTDTSFATPSAGTGLIGSDGSFQVNFGDLTTKSGGVDTLDSANLDGKFDTPTDGKLNWDISMGVNGSGPYTVNGSDLPFTKTGN